MSLEIINRCPICNAGSFSTELTCKDHTTSGELFNLQRCSSCSFLITNPRPDQTKIGKYYESKDYISHSNKSSGIFDSLYLVARKFTLRWKVNLLAKYSQQGTLLDYGCGTGEFLDACIRSGWKGFGIEPSQTASTAAQRKTQLNISQSIETSPQIQYDSITLWHVLEHVANLQQILQQLHSQLKPNGTLFVAVPNHKSYDAQKYQQHWAGYDVPRHLWHFSQSTMTQLIKPAGFRLEEIIPMKLDVYYISLLSQKYQTGRHTITGILKAALTAIRSNHSAEKTTEYSSLIYILKK